MGFYKGGQERNSAAGRAQIAVGPAPIIQRGELIVPNPKLRLMDQVREVLHQKFGNVQAVRADRPVRVPGVLTPEEVK